MSKIDDKEVVLIFSNRTKRVAVKHYPKMLVLVLIVNPRLKNYKSFSSAFCSAMQNKPEFQWIPENCAEHSAFEDEYERVYLEPIDVDRHLSTHTDAAELIK